MVFNPRTQLVLVDLGLVSTYPNGGWFWHLYQIQGGKLAPLDVTIALLRLRREVELRDGTLRFTTLGRSFEDQQQAHEDDPDNANRAGYSMHQTCRAIDVRWYDISDEAFAEAAAAAGWTSISGEAWHLEHYGDDWTHVRARLGSEEAAKAMCIDLGLGVGWYGNEALVKRMAVQVGCHRAGKDPGAVDGIIGTNTIAALEALSMFPDTTYDKLYQLASRPYW